MPSNHFDAAGDAHMVDVSAKQITKRTATASARITMNAEAAALVRSGTGRKGDVLSVARLAAIGATKWTSHLIPLCLAIPIESVSIDFRYSRRKRLEKFFNSTVTNADDAPCPATSAT